MPWECGDVSWFAGLPDPTEDDAVFGDVGATATTVQEKEFFKPERFSAAFWDRILHGDEGSAGQVEQDALERSNGAESDGAALAEGGTFSLTDGGVLHAGAPPGQRIAVGIASRVPRSLLYGVRRHIDWRMRERMKTSCVALVLCLNIGTDPPDVQKPKPCAKRECWLDPTALAQHKALPAIGKALQAQYERLQPRARYRQSLDPTVDDARKLCLSLRKNARRDRVLMHFNGHGVPRPTPNGEIWVFNKNYTQYIPLSVHEVQQWVGNPAVYVLDCSAAAVLLQHFAQDGRERPTSAAEGARDLGQTRLCNGRARSLIKKSLFQFTTLTKIRK